jgi:methionyl-tRNA formyltransferase
VVAQIADLAPDIGVVAAYGEILRKNVLAIPRHGYLNIHPSLLPRHRGPAPVTSAILAGDADVGVSVMQLGAKMDAGPILAQHRQPLTSDARAGALTEALFHVGAALLCASIQPFVAGTLIPTPQDESQATYIGLLQRSDGQLDWRQPASHLERMIRAYDPWPGTFATYAGSALRILQASVVPWSHATADPGTISDSPAGPVVRCGSDALLLQSVQPANGRPMSGDAWRRGLRAPLLPLT